MPQLTGTFRAIAVMVILLGVVGISLVRAETTNGWGANLVVTGTKVVYVSSQDGNEEIYRFRDNGIDQARLTNNPSVDNDASWSPDGQNIIFTSQRDGNSEVYIMNADGTAMKNLSNNPAWDIQPSWFPDGNQIIFSSNRDGNYEIYKMKIDGSGIVRLSNRAGDDQFPIVSPKGNKICYNSDISGNVDIFVMNTDNSASSPLIASSSVDQACVWSPDGNQIIFETNRDGQFEVYKANADGSNQQRLTYKGGGLPSWSSDGQQIWFHSSRSGEFKIYVMDKDGVLETCISCGLPGSHFRPSAYTELSRFPDLDVTYISRNPKYNPYKVRYTMYSDGVTVPYLEPGSENDKRVPTDGENVSFTAHVINKGSSSSPSANYQWLIDDVVVQNGMLVSLSVGQEITVTYNWVWKSGVHTVTFKADPLGNILESSKVNNIGMQRTNALSFAIYVDPTIYARMNTLRNVIGSYSFEDWIQWQVAKMNQRLEQACYPVSPQGVLDRVYIDLIEINSQLPNPPASGYDGRWLFGGSPDYANIFANQIDWGLIHELTHQLGIIDLYHVAAAQEQIFVLDQYGQRVTTTFLWQDGVIGLMGGGDTAPYNNTTFYSSHTSGGFVSNAGYRRGYYGEYLYDTPTSTFIQVLDSDGYPVFNANISVYQRNTSAIVDNIPEIQGTTDINGIYQLTNRIPVGLGTTTATGHTIKKNPFGSIDVVGRNGIMLIKITKNGQEEFKWLNITWLNINYWSGKKDSQTYSYMTRFSPTNNVTYKIYLPSVQTE